jgi:isopentenyl diphosphate isomerase/L-lactate dehydrogenase-like FMN-dependent dehydrogenase
VLRDASAVTTGTELLGTSVATPVGVAPTAFHRLAHADGKLATAAGAARAGAVYVLSARSTCRIEDVAAVVAAAGGAWWFQVYLMRDRARPPAWSAAARPRRRLSAPQPRPWRLAGAAAAGEIAGLGWPAPTGWQPG